MSDDPVIQGVAHLLFVNTQDWVLDRLQLPLRVLSNNRAHCWSQFHELPHTCNWAIKLVPQTTRNLSQIKFFKLVLNPSPLLRLCDMCRQEQWRSPTAVRLLAQSSPTATRLSGRDQATESRGPRSHGTGPRSLNAKQRNLMSSSQHRNREDWEQLKWPFTIKAQLQMGKIKKSIYLYMNIHK